MQYNEHNTADKQGNDLQQDSKNDIAWPVRIRRKPQITQASHIADAQKRPKQEHGSDQDGAVKECVEIVFRQKRKHAVCCKRLGRPEKNWSKEGSDDDDRDKSG